MTQTKTFQDPKGAPSTTKAKAAQIKSLETGGAGSQPRMKANPVKNSSCQPKGLKNHSRLDHGSAGKPRTPVCATSHVATTAAPISQTETEASPITIGIIAKITRYIGRMSK